MSKQTNVIVRVYDQVSHIAYALIFIPIMIFVSWIIGNGGTHGYYLLKSKIFPAKVRCQIKQVNVGYYDLLVVNKQTNEGTLYKGFMDSYEMHNLVYDLPRGNYSLYSNLGIEEINLHHEIEAGSFQPTFINIHRQENLADTPSEWKEFISLNFIKDKSILDYIFGNPKISVLPYSYTAD